MVNERYVHNIAQARKSQICDCCGYEIKPGEKYSVEHWNDGRRNYFRKLCLICNEIYYEYAKRSGRDREIKVADVEYFVDCQYCDICDHNEYREGDCCYLPLNCPSLRKEFAEKLREGCK